MVKETLTPIRRQYLGIKKQYPGAIVFFRLGDFYETFDEDARLTSRELEITLTSREMGKGNVVPMAGIPYHALDNYLARLIRRGHRVAICEQLTEPGATRGIVERDVIRVVTPGTVIEPALLENKTNNYLVGLVGEGSRVGLAYVDITTSEFGVTEMDMERLPAELERLKPSEIALPQNGPLALPGNVVPLTRLDDYWFGPETAVSTLKEHFGAVTLESFGLSNAPLAARAAGAVIHYLAETQKAILGQLTRLVYYAPGAFMTLDERTRHNLALFEGSQGTETGSLLSILDLTETAMGGRLLRKWLGQPLLDLAEIRKRQDAVADLARNTMARKETRTLLANLADLERLTNRIRGGIAGPREVSALRCNLKRIPRIKEVLAEARQIAWLNEELRAQPEIISLISCALVDTPPVDLAEGGVIRSGFSPELDDLRTRSQSAREYLAGLETRERERTGIKSLRIGFNNIYGYYIEISRANLAQAPTDYIRKQTLTTGERFFTPELKEYEALILHARERIATLEGEIFRRILGQISQSGEALLALARALAHLDVLAGLAEVGVRYGYILPELNDSTVINIKNGRHPVVERNLAPGAFIANDTTLSTDAAQLIILTGPNMSGKSTYLRQVALIVLMAQIGSFVPADSAVIGMVDRIFTRIGAREDLTAGQSTFMVEMVETAGILHQATTRSLLILDEIGRGTSTYDGLAIAQAVAEYIHNHPHLGARTLFATHYHEMVNVPSYLPRARNYSIAVSEEHGEVVFLRRVIPGGVDKSYGIHVAKLAGLPRPVINRAREILDDLEGQGKILTPHAASREKTSPCQATLWAAPSPVLEELEKLDPDSLTPLEALKRLYDLKRKARG
jgi:DNA mismatch repair protein MutS